MNLLELQTQFQEYLLHDHDAIKKYVQGTKKLSADMRLDLYREAYMKRLVDALQANFPMLARFMGENAFSAMANTFLRSHPSRHRSIQWFGDELAFFLIDYANYASMPYLSEFAQFEWAMNIARDASDEKLLTANDIAAIPACDFENMRFTVHPSVIRLNLAWNVVPIWQTLMRRENPEEPSRYNKVTPWLIWRDGLQTRFCMLPDDEWQALDALMSGETFGEIRASIGHADEKAAGQRLLSFLHGWVQTGLLSAVTL